MLLQLLLEKEVLGVKKTNPLYNTKMDREKASFYDRTVITHYQNLKKLNNRSKYLSFAKLEDRGERIVFNERFADNYMNNREKEEDDFSIAVFKYERDLRDAVREEIERKIRKAGLLDLVEDYFRFK